MWTDRIQFLNAAQCLRLSSRTFRFTFTYKSVVIGARFCLSLSCISLWIETGLLANESFLKNKELFCQLRWITEVKDLAFIKHCLLLILLRIPASQTLLFVCCIYFSYVTICTPPLLLSINIFSI